jgi:hypothetical protein
MSTNTKHKLEQPPTKKSLYEFLKHAITEHFCFVLILDLEQEQSIQNRELKLAKNTKITFLSLYRAFMFCQTMPATLRKISGNSFSGLPRLDFVQMEL